jgi:hypothetical protein
MMKLLLTFLFTFAGGHTWKHDPEPVDVSIKLVENSELALNNLQGTGDQFGWVNFHAARDKNMLLLARRPGTGEEIKKGFVIWKEINANVREYMIFPWSAYFAHPDDPYNWDFYLQDEHLHHDADNKGGEIDIKGSGTLIIYEGTVRVKVGAEAKTYTVRQGEQPIKIKF